LRTNELTSKKGDYVIDTAYEQRQKSLKAALYQACLRPA
jgi:hypothetical protein